jgi:hypothetical protein
MTPVRVLLLGLACAALAAAPAAAQTLPQGQFPPPQQGQSPWPQQGPAQPFPSPPPPGQLQSTFPAQPPGGGQQECLEKFVPLRAATEKAANAIKTATERGKPPAAEACKLLSNFYSAEAKMLKYMEANSFQCGIPPQAVTQVKANHAQLAKVRKGACDAAKGGGGGPPLPPSLSDALGTTRVPDASTTRTGTGGGTFDTLTGNPLAR